jgi:hypothetical protein
MRDEEYIVDLCDRVLGHQSRRQKRFDFLRGDSGRMLPVDAYYPALNLVIEYRERQHSGPHAFFDRRMTISGITRGQQRQRYDQRRRERLRENAIDLLELNVGDFPNRGMRRLNRTPDTDTQILRAKLSAYICRGRTRAPAAPCFTKP